MRQQPRLLSADTRSETEMIGELVPVCGVVSELEQHDKRIVAGVSGRDDGKAVHSNEGTNAVGSRALRHHTVAFDADGEEAGALLNRGRVGRRWTWESSPVRAGYW